MTAIAIQHRDEIINRVANGEYLASIAKSFGLAGKGQAISNALAKDDEYHAARMLGLEAKLAGRESELEESDAKDVPRARELLSHARWRAERECPERWGPKQQIAQVVVQVTADELMGDAGDLLKFVAGKLQTGLAAQRKQAEVSLPAIDHSQVTDPE